MRKTFTKWSALALLISTFYLSNPNKASGQTASQYGFTAVAGTYTPLVGGTAFTAVQTDDVCPTTTIPLNFSFNFCGISYTTVRASSNGYLTFSTGTANTAANDATSFATIKPALMWLWDDLNGATTGAASYTTTGAAPNRIFTMEFKNWRWNWSATGPNISCQVKLYETTNVIEYVYNQEAQPGAPLTSGGASIGILDGAATPTYLSLNNATATPAASSTVFTTNIGTKPASGQIYRWTPPVNCSAVTTWPASATTTVTPGTVCAFGSITLGFNPVTPLPPALGLSYQWQSAPAAGGPWTNIGTSTVPTFTTTTITPFYRCQLLCNTSTVVMTSSASAQVIINNPGNATGTGATRCGPGTVNLTATSSASGTNLNWYTTATGGAPIGTGSPWTTPYNPTTTTYYVASEINTPATATIGNGTLVNTTTTYPTPYGNWFTASHDQYLIRASEMIAAGFSAGSITSLAFNQSTGYAATNSALQQFKIMIGNASQTTMPTSLITNPIGGFTTVVPAATTTPPATAGPVTYTFSTPFIWDGVSSVVVDVSFSNAGAGCITAFTNNGIVTQSATSFVSTISYIGDGNCTINTMTPNVTGSNYSQRPNMTLTGTGTCANARVPVVATITAGPAINIAKPAVVCANEIGNIVVSSAPMSNYTTYAWTPNVADLYTNAGATTPYAGGSAPNAYFKSSVNGAHTYYLFSSGATPAACTHADTFSIWVQPDSISIKGTPDSICVSGTSILSLLPATGYAPNSIQWQESVNGTTYANITGATGTSYTTPTLTANHYYRVLIKSTNDTCEMPVKYVVVVNPTLFGVTDSFNCGPGTVTLQAQTGGNSTAKWYDVPTGGLAIGAGTPWTTPSLSASQTYYVSAEGGAGGGAPVTIQVGAGTTSSGGTGNLPGPFSEWWRRYSLEFLYTAPEIIAAGGNPGNFTSLAFNCTSLPANPIPDFTVKVKFVPSTMTTLATWQTTTTQVYTIASFMPVIGWNTFTFTGAPLVWNGTDNIVIEVCRSQVQPGFSATGNHQSRTITGRFLSNNTDAAGSSCGIAGTAANTNLPNARFGMQAPCETPRMAVHANIYPKPAVDLGPDVNMCVDAGAAIVLDAGVQPNTPSFLWDDNSISQVRAVNSSGTYNVKVTNSYTCVGSDTVNVILRKNPVAHLGNDTTVCNGVTLTLNPGGGSIEYFWNTGQVGQTIDVNSPGTYSVFVTNADGCTVSDTIQITMQGELPTINGIQVSNDGVNRFHFTAVYPQNVIGYDWDFGDGSLHSYEASPTHQYDSVGDYIVVLHLSSTCGFASDTVGAHIVGIHQLNVSTNELTVYPNPSSGQATILNKGDLKMEKIEIYSVLGQVVYRSKADSKDKHVINLSDIASGIYTIEVYTDKGTVARKLEIIK